MIAVCATDNCAAEIGRIKDCIDTTCNGKPTTIELCSGEIRSGKVETVEYGSAQRGSRKICPFDLCPSQYRTGYAGICEINIG